MCVSVCLFVSLFVCLDVCLSLSASAYLTCFSVSLLVSVRYVPPHLTVLSYVCATVTKEVDPETATSADWMRQQEVCALVSARRPQPVYVSGCDSVSVGALVGRPHAAQHVCA